jgi:two-component system sensor histidine kinase UhpB
MPMSLRFRLNLLVTSMFVLILVLGAVLVIYNARRAVFQETQSTAQLALQLLDAAYASAGAGGAAMLHARLAKELRALESARHLQVILLEEGREIPLGAAGPAAAAAPEWFVRLVGPREAIEFSRTIASAGGGTEIVVRADAADEITESWQDARTVLGLVLVFSLIANGVLYVTIGRWLRPLDRIIAALGGIEQGDYRARLPALRSPELGLVVDGFNRMAEALEHSREENRQLAEKSLAIQEAERRALAQELHDDLGQSISAIKAVAVSIGQEPSSGANAGAARTIAEISDHIYASVRGMMRRLRPVLLDEFGLVRAVEDLVDGWNERHADSFCRLETRGCLDDLGDALEIGIFRMVQESLTNASKHSQASEVTVTIERRAEPAGDCVRIAVRDDGRGFDPRSARRGLGLLGMRERAAALSGRFEVRSAPGQGVAISIELPVEKAAA